MRTHPLVVLSGLPFAVVGLASVAGAQAIGPIHYLSFADSPYDPAFFAGYFYMDDLEDGLLNLPGLGASAGGVTGPTPFTDSVDADDGSIDGSGLMGRSYVVAGSGNPTVTFSFNVNVLPAPPTHVGIVATDAFDPVFVEAFGPAFVSLGVVTVTGFGPDPDTQGQTAEDQFVGFVNGPGIYSLRVWTQGGGGLELDHIQYGFLTPIPPPGTGGYCSCDGQGSAPPCGNAGQVGHGCRNGSFASGANLWASGIPSVSQDTLRLHVTNSTPLQPGLYFMGDQALNNGEGVVFGDGLRCVGVNVLRLEVGMADGSGSGSTLLHLGNLGTAQPGHTVYYQHWYRSPTQSPCGTSFNLSNAYRVEWGQ